jgi:hypothetical protein
MRLNNIVPRRHGRIVDVGCFPGYDCPSHPARSELYCRDYRGCRLNDERYHRCSSGRSRRAG